MQTTDLPCEASVLLIAFRRPETTARVFEAIRGARPKQLYVAANAPRPGNTAEAEGCAAVRKLVQAVDWDCSLHTLFRDEHLPVGASVSSAISWFLDAAEEGIILEDDCLPDPSFFPFCGEMLERYRNTTHVMQVAGYNRIGGRHEMPYDYYFTHFGWQWGWATWKRAWAHFDLKMSSWPEFKRRGFHRYFPFYPGRAETFDRTFAGKISTWDYQWHYAMAANSGISIVPKQNLVQNIGIGTAGSTHLASASRGDRLRIPVQAMPSPVTHCPFVYADRHYDESLIRAVSRKTLRAHVALAARRILRRS